MTDADSASGFVTFAELGERIVAKRDRAYEETSRAGWHRLLDLSLRLGGEDDDGILVTGRVWRLASIRICGYQGIPQDRPLEVLFDPTPGITVLHGPNGAGKSSIADALDTVLRGEPQPPAVTGAGGRAPLWERQHIHRDAVHAEVGVVLVDGEDRLRLSVRLGDALDVLERGAELESAGTTTPVEPGDAWASALSGYRPVYGYAAVERRVQAAKDLQSFLEPMLALGGCFTALEAAVEEGAAPALEAHRVWSAILGNVRTAVASVDDERRRPDLADAPSIAWPELARTPRHGSGLNHWWKPIATCPRSLTATASGASRPPRCGASPLLRCRRRRRHCTPRWLILYSNCTKKRASSRTSAQCVPCAARVAIHGWTRSRRRWRA